MNVNAIEEEEANSQQDAFSILLLRSKLSSGKLFIISLFH